MQADRTFNIATLIEEQKTGRFAVGLLFWCFLIMLMDGYDQTAVSFAAPAIIKEWHVARGGFGAVFGAGLFGTLIGSFIFGYLGDRLGRKKAIVIGSIFFGLLTYASVWVTSLQQLMLLRFLAGIGMGGVVPNSVALVAEYAPRRLRATWVTLMFSGFSIGAGSGGLVSSALIHRFGWPVMFAVGGGGSLLVALLVIFTLPESAKLLVIRQRNTPMLHRLMTRLRPELNLPADAQFIPGEVREKQRFVLKLIFSDGLAAITPLLWIVFIANSMALYFLQNWLPILIEAMGVDPRGAGLITMMFSVGGVIGGLILCRFVDKHGVLAIISLPVIGFPVVALLGHGSSQAWLMLAVFAAGFCVVGAQYGLYAVAGMIYPTSFRSAGVGSAISVGKIGSVSGPVIGGVLLSMHLPITQLFYAASLLFLIAAVFSTILALLYRARFREQPVPVTAPDGAVKQMQRSLLHDS
ncbi:MFS transporter [Paraburkholderia sp. JPY303]|uniref:AAHS family 4-hydroxybenzoate transporter-like MFS transporter n=1 Tax=Paraburkholderia atlantica TaxID=2654982 RepID=A0A7W8Q5J9_PARAM|nr:MFS transporter [Paraburkholderia atlantica]MBB5424130.1 AAHS family 4-hydroxybenzoate transporter-like MFS transporter [Paraburkholderia atlantica]NUY31057.1 MFS transporter [Paraburkholderia atlantica]